jgi:hypothetical protein
MVHAGVASGGVAACGPPRATRARATPRVGGSAVPVAPGVWSGAVVGGARGVRAGLGGDVLQEHVGGQLHAEALRGGQLVGAAGDGGELQALDATAGQVAGDTAG